MILLYILILIYTIGQVEAKDVRVFVLAGGSNAEGRASVEHLHQVIRDNEGKENPYQKYQNLDGSWAKKDNVIIVYQHDRHGKFLSKPAAVDNMFGHAPDEFGPDVGMAWALGEAFPDEVTVLLKCGRDHATLAGDFRPPRAGGTSGFEWARIWSNLDAVEASLEHLIDGKVKHPKAVLSGFVWFHGFEDMFRLDSRQQYQQNLEDLLRDARTEANNLFLPIVIGEMGGSGPKPPPKEDMMRVMQHHVAILPENKETVEFVKTAQFVYEREPHILSNIYYYGLGDAMISIGEAFGSGMLRAMEKAELAKEQQASSLLFFAGELQAVLFFVIIVTGLMYAVKSKKFNPRDVADRVPLVLTRRRDEDGIEVT